MKKALVFFALAAVLVFPPVLAPAGATDLLVDNFDGYRAGESISAKTTGWLPFWNAVNDPVNNIWTDQAGSVDPGRGVVMQAYGDHAGCWASDSLREFAYPADAKTKIYIQFDMMPSGDILATGNQVCPENRYDIGARLFADTSGNWNGKVANLVVAGIEQVHDGRMVIDNALAPNRWYRVLVEVDRSTGAKRLWRDGSPWADLTGSPDPALLSDGSPVGYVSFTSGGGKGWIDRVRVFTDTVPPVTRVSLAGKKSCGIDSYSGGVTVSLSAVDDGTGVDFTEYSLDAGGNWSRYFVPFKITAEGATAIDYRSVDKAGNVELFGVAAFSIDKAQGRDRGKSKDNDKNQRKDKKQNHRSEKDGKGNREYGERDRD
ncbi:MAG TPA: hypothetical protein VGK27_05255 [Candidatus Deferrimicrobiaceae bacterium]|jgi:hypothetical protein